jgi:outer membrane protein insertion porin family
MPRAARSVAVMVAVEVAVLSARLVVPGPGPGVARADEPAPPSTQPSSPSSSPSPPPSPSVSPGPGPASQPAGPAALEGDPTFGPLVTIERIQISGNVRTSELLIRRALLVKEGETLRTGDPRFRTSRFRVLSLGYFADVQLILDKGSQRGSIVLIVDVVERGTFILNRLFLGASQETPIWAGLDIGDANLFGSGLGVSAAAVWAEAPNIADGAAQWALRLEAAVGDVGGLPLGLHGSFLAVDASEAFRVAGDLADGDPLNFAALRYRRFGGILGATWDLTRLDRLHADARFEVVEGPDPVPAGARLLAGTSRVATLALGFERDTRPDPVLPSSGDRLFFAVEAGGAPLGGNYDYLRARATYERWIPLPARGHVVSFHLGGGLIVGDAPRFDRFYVGDVNPLLPPRPLDLVVSTRPDPDLLGTGADRVSFGDLYAGAMLEYSYHLFRHQKTIYGGDLFAQVGVFGLGRAEAGDASDPAGGFPLDLTFNLGLRLDTAIGVFELSLGNLAGRIPF